MNRTRSFGSGSRKPILVAFGLDDPDVFTPQTAVYPKRALDRDLIGPALPGFEEMPAPGDVAS